jgi:hypothetical protein
MTDVLLLANEDDEQGREQSKLNQVRAAIVSPVTTHGLPDPPAVWAKSVSPS